MLGSSVMYVHVHHMWHVICPECVYTLYNTRQCFSCLIAGVLLISLALCADAVIGNVQEKALKQHFASNVEMVLYSYAVGFVYILVGVLVSQSFLPAFLYCLKVHVS